MAAGMNDHIGKPFDPQQLWEALRKWLPTGRAAPAAPGLPPVPGAGAPSLPPALQTIEGLDSAQGLRRSGGKLALYLSLLPQFIKPEHGDVLTQSLVLGFTQIVISVGVNAMIAMAAGSLALFLGQRPTWLVLQRWLMGTVLAGLAVRMLADSKR